MKERDLAAGKPTERGREGVASEEEEEAEREEPATESVESNCNAQPEPPPPLERRRLLDEARRLLRSPEYLAPCIADPTVYISVEPRTDGG